ncbi:lipase family protein [Ralstonia pseudosolanacearum]|uniref:Lipase family protein n=1 Tax=Ralstonia solanacearum TaxID=305 RepID=A0ABY6ND33_RALSL|nr:lipase family protein [Ralstonia solanacearum]
MYQYAIHEVHRLASGLPSPLDDRNPIVRYLCALFAELAYYHVPQWEIDSKKRAKLVPCDAYRALVSRGRSTDLNTLLQQLDLPQGFAVADRGAVAVGLVLNRMLFIGFRGTQFLFDWKINLRSELVPVNARFRVRGPFVFSTVSGRLHAGFAEEAMRISSRVLDVIRDSQLGDIDHVFLTGHSLGGAVAAISENFIRLAPTSVCILGAPRYADLSAYVSLPDGPPTQIRRPGDIVPTVPPRVFGYAHHPYEFATNGATYIDPAPYSSSFGGIVRWARFLFSCVEPHKMEIYRNELGVTAGAQGAKSPLAPQQNLTVANIGASSDR